MAEWRSRAWATSGRPRGATDGFTAHTRKKMIAKAAAEAKGLIKIMKEKGLFTPKNEAAEEAFETVLTEMRRKDLLPKDKLSFARTVLEYSMAKPAAETNLTVKRAEDFLNDLANEAGIKD